MKTRYNKFVLVAIFSVIAAVNLFAQPTVLPYKNGFEGATTGWNFVSDPHNPANAWVVGTAVKLTGAKSLYVSADGGITANYNDTASSTVFAYCSFTLPEYHSYSIYFDWRSGGAIGDSLYVCWVNDNTPILPEANGTLPTWVNATKKLVLGGQPTTWQNTKNSFSVCGTGQPAKLVFVWRNNGDGVGPSTSPSSSRSPAGSIDNLQINQNSDLNYKTGFDSAAETVGWTLYNGTCQNKWVIDTANYFSNGRALYISKDGGATHSYGNSRSCVSAVKEFTIPAGDTVYVDFEYMVGGELNDYLLVGWLTDTTRTNFTNTSGSPPAWFIDGDGNPQIPPYLGKLSNALTWKHFSARFVGNGRPGKLIFMWVNDNNIMRAPAAIIDNLTITRANGCPKPSNVNVQVDARGITVYWAGVADSYNLSYYYTAFIDGEYQRPQYVTIENARSPYTLPNMYRGIYSFAVNAVCVNGLPYCGANGNIEYKNDTSAWGTKHGELVVINPGCIDYTKLSTSNGVIAEYASSWTGTPSYGLVDFGYADWRSRHTIHYVAEMDTITMGGLRTIPPGSLASVRLGNKGNSGEMEGLTYEFYVDSTYAVLVLRYATVLEAPGHGLAADPKVHLQILNANNAPIGGVCGDVLLSSDNANFNDPTWHHITPQTLIAAGIKVPNGTGTSATGLRDFSTYDDGVYWKDWTTIGINLRDYKGQRVKVRIRNYDCDWGGHFAYSYFTLDCGKSELEGLSCGDTPPEAIVAPEGFTYCWYKKFNPNGTIAVYNPANCVSRDRTFVPSNTDTATYICRVTSVAVPTCYFELLARLAPRLPQARAGFTQESVECKNLVHLKDNSVVMYGNNLSQETTETSHWLVKRDIDTVFISNLRNPTFVAPNEGCYYDVRLVSGISGKLCTDTLNFEMRVAPISNARDTTKISICYSQLPYTYGGKVYDVGDIQDGFIINNDTIITGFGCDSILTLLLKVSNEIVIETDSTICKGESVLFEGIVRKETGVYSKTHQTVHGCDSIMRLNLLVNPVIEILKTHLPIEICANDHNFTIDYESGGGAVPTKYLLTFNEKARNAGFVNDTIEADGTSKIVVAIPANLRPDKNYSVDIEFIDIVYNCKGPSVPVPFDVLYPNYILEQKWNDVIALLKPNTIVALPYDGHTSNVDDYTFNTNSYRWYKGDVFMNEVKAYIYVEGGLDKNAKYKLQITRTSDNVELFTCTHKWIEYNEAINVPIVLVQGDNGIKMMTENSGVVNVYNVTGILVSSQKFNDGETIINAPAAAGVYILNINLDNGDRYQEKIIVK